MKRLLFIFAILFFQVYKSYGQVLCGTPAITNNENARKLSSPQKRSVNSNYILTVYFHVIRTSSGTGGVTTSNVTSAFNRLNQDFNSHGISFNWNGDIEYIDNNTYYYGTPNTSIFNVGNHINGIDIYLFPSSTSCNFTGLANGIGMSSEYLVVGNISGTPACTTSTISHEMGHVLNLWHTHHGTYDEGGNDNPCPELVNGSNSSSCGDYVEDTPADPNLSGKVNSNCIYTGTGTDANNQAYAPDVDLIMSYARNSCRTRFSTKQGERMRDAIENLPYLMHTQYQTISGPSVFCCSSSGTYSISNLPSSYTVFWNVSNNNNFNITTSGNQCLVTYTGSQGYGVANLTARVYYQGSFIKQLTKLIRTGTPDLDEIVFYNYYGEGNWIEGDAGNVAMVAGGSTPYYDQYECNIYRINNQFQEELVRHAFNYMPSFELSTAYEGWYTVYIRGINDCGYSEWSSGEIECEAPSNNGPENMGETQCFIIYDPDSNNLSVRWNEEALLQSSTIQKNTTPSTYEVQVWNETKLVKSVFSNQQETMVSLTGLPKGFYIAKVIRDGKNYAKKFAIKK